MKRYNCSLLADTEENICLSMLFTHEWRFFEGISWLSEFRVWELLEFPRKTGMTEAAARAWPCIRMWRLRLNFHTFASRVANYRFFLVRGETMHPSASEGHFWRLRNFKEKWERASTDYTMITTFRHKKETRSRFEITTNFSGVRERRCIARFTVSPSSFVFVYIFYAGF